MLQEISRVCQDLARRHEEIFLAFINNNIIPKIKRDIETILKNGWADEISRNDLYHAHIIVPRNLDFKKKIISFIISKVLFFWDVEEEKDEEKIIHILNNSKILYHSHEGLTKDKRNIDINRNIISELNNNLIYTNNSKFTITPNDLGCYEAIHIFFEIKNDELKFEFYIYNGKEIPEYFVE